MTVDIPAPPTVERLTTGVRGFDEILMGGLIRSGIYLVMGRPGTGKTTLANQVCFHHVETGGRAVYVTLLAESHAQMITHLKGFRFFKPGVVADTVQYVSGYQSLEAGKMEGLLALMRRTLRDNKATLLVIDGLLTANSIIQSGLEVKRFIHELETLMSILGCTALLLTGSESSEANYPERTMVDGIIGLGTHATGMRTHREIEVVKFRGSDGLSGKHFFQISSEGVTVHPRIEALLHALPPADDRRERLAFGVRGLDAMTSGGVLSGSTTLVVGCPGAGKTLLGLHFLTAGAERGEAGLHLGFYESPPRLLQKAKELGIPLANPVRSGQVELMWRPGPELVAEILIEDLLSAVKVRGVRRLVVDGMDRLIDSVIYPERQGAFFTAVSNQLRMLNVTAMFTSEARTFLESGIQLPITGISCMTENLILLRYLEEDSGLHRVGSILKMREGDYDASMRRITIGPGGMEVGEQWGSRGPVDGPKKRPSVASRAKTSKVNVGKRTPRSRKV